jgi:hypothetical protein
MGLVDTQPLPNAASPPETQTVCRCGHCRTVIDVPEGQRRVHCPECGRSNAVPKRVYVTCERCNAGQRIRFSQRNDPPLCVNCGHSFRLRAVELTPQQRHVHVTRGHTRRHDNAVLAILLYAIALVLFLCWLIQR